MNLELVLNALEEGIVIADQEGRIVYFNNAYGKFINRQLDDAKGEYLSSIRPGARLPEVIKSGKALEQVHRQENGEEYFVNIYPLREKNEIKGAVSIVTSLKNAKYLSETIRKLEEREAYLESRMKQLNGTRYSFENIIYGSEVSKRCIEAAKRIAHSDISVLLQGESGCGKELYAQSIHNESERRNYPFVAVNCAVLTGNLLESELFGYDAGAFTGAGKNGKAGLFEIAHKGTLFLDEVSEMDYNIQAKLLRALQERKIRRIGGVKEIDIDVRIVCACNVNLLKYVEENKFRRDLYYRIAAVPLQIVPLRERREDIEPLIDSHLSSISIHQKKNMTISQAAKDILLKYDWPGNVRELKNVLEYAALMMDGECIDVTALPQAVTEGREASAYKGQTLSESVKQFEKQQITEAINHFGDTLNGKKQAAKQLGISLATLYNKLSQS